MKFSSLAIAAVLTLGLAGTVSAQTQVPSPTPPTTKLAWNHDGVNVQGYRLYVDAATTGSDLGNPAPVAGTVSVNFPALTPGLHTLAVTAYNIAGESAKSNTLSVNVVVIPLAPTNLRIIVAEAVDLIMPDIKLAD